MMVKQMILLSPDKAATAAMMAIGDKSATSMSTAMYGSMAINIIT